MARKSALAVDRMTDAALLQVVVREHHRLDPRFNLSMNYREQVYCWKLINVCLAELNARSRQTQLFG